MTSSRPARRFDWSNLGLRTVSALVLAPLAALALWMGGIPFVLIATAAVVLLAIEWSGMSTPNASKRMAWAIAVGSIVALLLAYLHYTAIAWSVIGVTAVVCALLALQVGGKPGDGSYGAVYIGAPIVALAGLRLGDPEGGGWVLLLLAATWSADVAAFAVGNILKGPKLWPRYSPHKTWSGFAGGLAGATVAGLAVAALGWIHIALWLAALIGLVAGLATMAGDLWESMLKRRFGVKDSGDLIPGHGGLLDRVDGLIFAILAVAAMRLVIIGWPG